MEILAIIPARGGSKGIARKNIRSFCGKPLLSYAILEAKKSKHINRIVVSTEDLEIAEVARHYGAEIPCLRPAELARDKSKATDAVLHLLQFLKKQEGYVPEYLVLLQATSPLRTVEDIDGVMDLLIKRGADAAVSVCGTEQLLYTKDKTDRLKLVSSSIFLNSSNRQELPPTYKLDGSMVYAIKTKAFLREKTFLAKNLVGYAIPRWRAVDLDEPEDFVVGELIFKNKAALVRRLANFK